MRTSESNIRQSINLCSSLIGLIVWTALLLVLTTWPAAAAPTLRANGKIAFTSDRDGNLEIYVMNNDGTGQVRLTQRLGICKSRRHRAAISRFRLP